MPGRIRKGSTASDESVRGRATGQPLRFEVVSGDDPCPDQIAVLIKARRRGA
ncbi:MAG TPA: hypothetical protein VKK31_02555 [Thermoanaerobaculia bacterium]|nr:hypothetical protein [Thermoanaerobaculia bacterium]